MTKETDLEPIEHAPTNERIDVLLKGLTIGDWCYAKVIQDGPELRVFDEDGDEIPLTRIIGWRY